MILSWLVVGLMLAAGGAWLLSWFVIYPPGIIETLLLGLAIAVAGYVATSRGASWWMWMLAVVAAITTLTIVELDQLGDLIGYGELVRRSFVTSFIREEIPWIALGGVPLGFGSFLVRYSIRYLTRSDRNTTESSQSGTEEQIAA